MIQTEKAEKRNSENKIPTGWKWEKLGEICKVTWGNTSITKASYVPSGYLAFSASGSDGYLGHYEYDRSAVVLSAIGARCGKCFLAEGKWTAIKNTIVLFPKEDRLADIRYLFFYLNQEQLWPKDAMAQPFITMGGAQSVDIPLPPLPEQKRIAGILNEQMAAVDRARIAAEAQLEAAKVLRAAYLRVLYDGPEAQLWPKIALGELLSLRKEVVYPKDNPVGTATFVGLEHIESHTGLRFGCVDLDLSQLTGRKPRFKAGDIVYGYLRPYLNKVWVAEFDGLCSVDQYVYSVRQEKADTEFIAAFMRSPVYLERAPIQTTPGQLPRIRTEEVAIVKIGLPSLSEQRRIAKLLAERLSVTDRAQKAANSKLETINKLPSALLRRAFNGEM